MSNAVEKMYVAVACGEVLLGIMANGFIGVMKCIDCVKTRKVSYLNFILTGLAISRIGLLGIITSHVFAISFYPSSYLLGNMKNSNALWSLANNSSTWFSACLSVFYLLKIANFSHPIFLWLKWRINKGVLKVLLGCYFLSFLLSLMVTLMSDVLEVTVNLESKLNLTQKIQVHKNPIFAVMMMFSVGGILPFALSLISCFLLVLSLWRHTQQMQLNATGSRDPSIEAHVRAMKSMVSFLFLFVGYYVGMFSIITNGSILERKTSVLFTLMAMIMYPLAHSIIIIVGHNKLRLTALRVLWKFRVYFKCFGKC
uniref:Taste receptor type 2 n=1 Tax=Monodelphis domestica TaxID=13616 RepID=Q2AB97_MONDO|nr:bitter taste receptor Modo-T2R22 [Monodelphis domestica]BAE80370.1 bitter taste receptor [Monodelphis domestica]